MTKSASVILALIVGFLIGHSLSLWPPSTKGEDHQPIDDETLGDIISYTWLVSANFLANVGGMFYGRLTKDQEMWEESCQAIKDFWTDIESGFLEKESGPTFSATAPTAKKYIFMELVTALASNDETRECTIADMKIEEDEDTIEVEVHSRW